jgi:hypothetical protein
VLAEIFVSLRSGCDSKIDSNSKTSCESSLEMISGWESSICQTRSNLPLRTRSKIKTQYPAYLSEEEEELIEDS